MMSKFQAIYSKFQLLQKSCTTLACSSKSFTRVVEYSEFSTLDYGAYISIVPDHLENKRVDEARNLFDGIPSPNVRLATKMISSYVENYRLDEALEMFDKMPIKDVVTWNNMIKGCVDCGNTEMGLKLFDEMPERNVISWTTVMNAMWKCGNVEEAEKLFCKMPAKDIAAWNGMIHGYFENSRVEEAMRLFGVMPSRNVISWTTVISGFDRLGRSDEALLLLKKMMRFGVQPTSSTLTSGQTACAKMGYLQLGSQIHGLLLKLGYAFDAYVTAALITLYANCKQIEDFVKAFNEKLHLNVVVWTSFLTGFGVNGKHEDALRVFCGMIRLGVSPNQTSFTSALNSSCEVESVDWGKIIHGATIKVGLEKDSYVGNSLVVLYTKCGNISDGIFTFKEISDKNIVSWNAIIVGSAQHGCGNWAIAFFSQMAKTGTEPDEITFTGLLNACSHSGMLQKGRHFFACLSQYSAIKPKLEHYACMVDILCRNGKLDDAEDLAKKMPMEPNLSIWLALLSGCRAQCNLEMAERVAKKVFEVDPSCSSAYVLLSNMYALAGRWTDAARTRMKMKNVKQLGCSWVTQ
ncbi:pentatricopeptide repeat-containing protein At5g46460, mitochondrial [Primulina eburnea]|uniref:pentatricopeptide repeat-containing protein At5g46460, mitochondrial n=1 Tax=Primulina eburnea TaxID=1245227 RepID=UPI003C6CC16B